MEKHHQRAGARRGARGRGAALAPLHPGAPAARQGGEPARHRLRARRDQPARGAGRGRGLRAGASRRWRPSWRSSAARRRSASIPRERERRGAKLATETRAARRAREPLEAEKALVERSWSCAPSCAARRQGRRHRQRAGSADAAAPTAAASAAAARPTARAPSVLAELRKLQAQLAELQGETPLILPTRRRAGRRLGRRRTGPASPSAAW